MRAISCIILELAAFSEVRMKIWRVKRYELVASPAKHNAAHEC